MCDPSLSNLKIYTNGNKNVMKTEKLKLSKEAKLAILLQAFNLCSCHI